MNFPNNNRSIIRKLTNRILKYNKTRNIMVIAAIILTTILFTTLFTISMGIVNTMQMETMRMAGGSAQGTLKNISEKEFNNLKKHPSIKQIEYSRMVGIAENTELVKHHTEIRYATDGDAKMNFSYPIKGNMPQKEDELATDTLVLDLLGIPKEIGESVNIDYSIDGKKFSKKFVLVGYWEHDKVSSASMVWVSKEFTDYIFKDFNKDKKDYSIGTGLIFADIIFKNSLDLDKKMQKVITESGYSIEENNDNYTKYGVNWAYMSTNFKLDIGNVLVIIAISALVVFTGYLIIYNIFQIYVFKDIRFFGLLKTIGTTSKQIKKIIRRQAILLSLIGIPIGLILGFILGIILLPIVMSVSNEEKTYASFSPIIFIGAALFSYITVVISSRKPGKIAANVSPMEAVKFTGEVSNNKKTFKSSNRGAKIYRMALSNLTRNKKKTIIVIISMSLSLILLNSVFTISKSFDLDKFLRGTISTDFVIGSTNYFNNKFNPEVDEVSQKIIDNINSEEGFSVGGKVFYNTKNITTIQNNVENILQLYGLEDFPLSKLKIVEGDFDLEKFKSGKYIIEGVKVEDNGEIIPDSSRYKIGDKVTFKFKDGSEKYYEVMAKAEIEYSFFVRYRLQKGENRDIQADNMYLPSYEFSKIVKNPVAMNYVFNVYDGYTENMDKFIKQYTSKVEPEMNYESKGVFIEQFKELKNVFLILGGALSFIIGIIGLLNFINSILTSILSRKREFAMLQSIGMTNKQLCKLLMCEGGAYAIFTSIIMMDLGSMFSLTAIRGVLKGIGFCSYRFVILPFFIAAPSLIVISIVIPFLLYKISNKNSIVERLRESE